MMHAFPSRIQRSQWPGPGGKGKKGKGKGGPSALETDPTWINLGLVKDPLKYPWKAIYKTIWIQHFFWKNHTKPIHIHFCVSVFDSLYSRLGSAAFEAQISCDVSCDDSSHKSGNKSRIMDTLKYINYPHFDRYLEALGVYKPIDSKVWFKLQLLQSMYSVCVHLVPFHSYQSKNTAMLTKKRFAGIQFLPLRIWQGAEKLMKIADREVQSVAGNRRQACSFHCLILIVMVLVCFDGLDSVLAQQTKPLSELICLGVWDSLKSPTRCHLQDMDSVDMMGPQQGMNLGSTAKKRA